jgi:hypothetical protein
MLAIFGASGAFAGLLLVFAGFVFAQAASFPSGTDPEITGRYTKAARAALLPFAGFLITTLLSLASLLWCSDDLYIASIAVFALLVVWTGVYGAVAAYRYL